MRQYGEDNQSKSKIFDWISWQPATVVGVFGCSSFISGPRIIITLQTVNGNVNALKILINFVWIWYELPYVAQCHLNMFSTEQKSICRLSCAWEEYGLMMSFVVACSLGSLSLTHTRPGVTHANTFERNICNLVHDNITMINWHIVHTFGTFLISKSNALIFHFPAHTCAINIWAFRLRLFSNSLILSFCLLIPFNFSLAVIFRFSTTFFCYSVKFLSWMSRI